MQSPRRGPPHPPPGGGGGGATGALGVGVKGAVVGRLFALAAAFTEGAATPIDAAALGLATAKRLVVDDVLSPP